MSHRKAVTLVFVAVILFIVFPAAATISTVTIPTPGTASYGGGIGFFQYNSTIGGIPILYEVLQGGIECPYWNYWRLAVDHTARFNLSYNNHNYSTVFLTVTDLGEDSFFNLSTSVGVKASFEYQFEWVDPAITSLPADVQFTALYDSLSFDSYTYNNITSLYAPGIGWRNWGGFPVYSNLNNTVKISDAIGMAIHQVLPYGSQLAKDGTYTYVYGAGTPPGPPSINASLSGHVNNAYSGAVIGAASVIGAQGTATFPNTSTSTGYYKLSGLIGGMDLDVLASKSGFTSASFTILSINESTNYVGNISLVPSFIPNSTALMGIVYANWNHAPIAGATVNIWNGTWSSSVTTSATGFFMFNGLAAETYHFTASAPGYVTSGTLDATAVAGITVEIDIGLRSTFAVTVNVKDYSTGALILGTEVNIQASDGQTTNTTLGTTVFIMDGGYYTFTATATGYSAGQVQESITGDTTVNILMSKASEPSSINYYMQKTVRLRAVDAHGVPLVGTTITVNYIASTLPSTNITWLVSAFGISSSVASEMTNGGIAMTGITTDDGSVTFVMFPALSYGVTLTNTPLGLSHYTTISPQDSDYTIYAALPSQARQNSTYMALSNTTLFITEPTASTVTFNLIYFDPTGLTTNLKFNVTCWSNNTPMYYVDLGNPGTSVVADSSYTVPNVKGQEWRFWYNATRSAPL